MRTATSSAAPSTGSPTTAAAAHTSGGTLLCGVAGLQLLSSSPEALAAIAALRFAHISYTVESDVSHALATVPAERRTNVLAALRQADASFAKHPSRADVPVYIAPNGACRSGVEHLVEGIAAHNSGSRHARLNAGLSAGQLALNDGLVALLKHTVFPAFEYCVYAHDATYALLQPALQQQAATFWQRLREPLPAYREAKLRSLRERYNFRSEADAIAAARKGLQAIERTLVQAGAVVASSYPSKAAAPGTAQKGADAGAGAAASAGGAAGAAPAASPSNSGGDVAPFLHGSAAPSTADCYAFAALSLAATARVAPTSAWAKLQVEAGLSFDGMDAALPANSKSREFPLSCFYGRSIATRYFEQYAGLHFVNLPPPDAAEAEDEDVYRPGRTAVVLGTVGFAFSYFLVSNAPTILELLLQLAALAEDGDEENGGGEGADEPAEGVIVHAVEA